MSDTPSTDAASLAAHGMPEGTGPWRYVESNFARQLERELTGANERIKRLIAAGDAIVEYNIGCGCGQDGTCRACRLACKAWTEAKE